jgi:hypothetical protein
LLQKAKQGGTKAFTGTLAGKKLLHVALKLGIPVRPANPLGAQHQVVYSAFLAHVRTIPVLGEMQVFNIF